MIMNVSVVVLPRPSQLTVISYLLFQNLICEIANLVKLPMPSGDRSNWKWEIQLPNTIRFVVI